MASDGEVLITAATHARASLFTPAAGRPGSSPGRCGRQTHRSPSPCLPLVSAFGLLRVFPPSFHVLLRARTSLPALGQGRSSGSPAPADADVKPAEAGLSGRWPSRTGILAPMPLAPWLEFMWPPNQSPPGTWCCFQNPASQESRFSPSTFWGKLPPRPGEPGPGRGHEASGAGGRKGAGGQGLPPAAVWRAGPLCRGWGRRPGARRPQPTGASRTAVAFPASPRFSFDQRSPHFRGRPPWAPESRVLSPAAAGADCQAPPWQDRGKPAASRRPRGCRS